MTSARIELPGRSQRRDAGAGPSQAPAARREGAAGISPGIFPHAELAELLAYPTERLPAVAEACRRAIAPFSKEAAADLLAFGMWAGSVALSEVQETYARTFDFNPALCLDLGYQLFGESYKRGVFLVKVQAAVREQGIAFAPELADHLPVVLRLLATLGADDARSLADEVVLPAVAKVLDAFVDKANPYLLVLDAAKLGLCAAYGVARIRPVPEELGGTR